MGSDSRCPLDRVFYVRSACLRCGGEVFPKERCCASCGERVPAGRPRVAAPLEPASVPARVAAFLLDGLALFLLVELVVYLGWVATLPPAWGLPLAAALLAPAYYAVLQAGAGQTLGQHVMGLVTLTEERTPLSLAASAKRTLLATLSWATLVLPWRAAVRGDGLTPADLWTSSRNWYDRQR